MSSSQAIATVINDVGGTVFATRPAKAIQSEYATLIPNVHVLLESNDPFAVVEDHLSGLSTTSIVTLTTTSRTLLHALPALSLKVFSSLPVVVHVELNSSDYSTISNLRDLGFPILISQTTDETQKFAAAAYNIAAVSNKLTFHFYAPTEKSTPLTTSITPVLSTKTLQNFGEILAEFGITPFEKLPASTNKPVDAIVLLGKVSDELIQAASKHNVEVLSIKVYKPFDVELLLQLLSPTVETITLVEQNLSTFVSFSPLMLDFVQDYTVSARKFRRIISANFGFVENYASVLENLLRNTRSASPLQNLIFGKSERSESNESETKLAVDKAYKLEQAYFKLVHQVATKELNFLNRYEDISDMGAESNPEYGFGRFLYQQQQFATLVLLVAKLVSENKFRSTDNVALIESLSQLSAMAKENKSEKAVVSRILELLHSDTETEAAKSLLRLASYFEITSNWIVGSDAWSYDLGASGVHNLITSRKNINMMLIDSEPYHGNGGKTVGGFRKKDVGLYAMNSGGCYVASVAIYSSYTQVLQALIEAEKFDGPSIVLAYLPYTTEDDDTLEILQQTKRAVDSGYWPLYRYDPHLEDEKQSFKLDSSNLKKQLKDFLDRENRLTLLAARNPVLSRNLTASANTQSRQHQKKVADDSFAKLLLGLSGPPLTIAFASDGGNAEGVAKKIHRQALGRGLKALILAMDDYLIEDLPKEVHIVFVTATSGQGEFPGNGKQFWDSLKNTPDFDLSAVKFSVFAMGDSEYWPRKEDKHYFNKPGKDLNARLELYGGVRMVDIGMGDDQDADGYNTAFNDWIPKIWAALGVDNVDGVEEPKPITNEDMKINSDFLRGTIAEALVDDSTGAISAVDQQLTKFHGIYMQDDRDIRDERKAQGLEPAYAFMIRVRLPGGMCTPAQYLKMNELSDNRGNGTIKITTRATFQLHGVVKHDMKPAIRGMNSALMDTLAACGDVNRNVMVSALPSNSKIHKQVADTGSFISEHLLPSTTAYYEIWLEGADDGDSPGDAEKWNKRKEGPTKKKTLVAENSLVDVEPLYGPTYLPRKFKIVITVPPYNDVDVYAHDIGLIAIVEDNEVVGFNLLAGGGMGTTHNNKKTYPRTASMFGYVAKDKVHIACEKVMLVQRDFGDRTNRKHARLKYTMDTLGVDVFKQKTEELMGFLFEEPREFSIESNVDYFGWCKDENGRNHFTAFIENGRIEDTVELPQKTGLKKIAEYLNTGKSGEFRLTGNQHLLISNIEDQDLEDVKALMKRYKLDNTNFSALRLSSAACVAFPTCGLAMAESERYLPKLITKLEAGLEEYGLRHDSVVMRMTGCPNGCARPWLAEVALVGKAYGAYNLLLGGGHHGQRLNKIYRYSIKEDEVLAILLPLFKRWSLERYEKEPFGDFVIRTGVIAPTTEGRLFYEGVPIEA